MRGKMTGVNHHRPLPQNKTQKGTYLQETAAAAAPVPSSVAAVCERAVHFARLLLVSSSLS